MVLSMSGKKWTHLVTQFTHKIDSHARQLTPRRQEQRGPEKSHPFGSYFRANLSTALHQIDLSSCSRWASSYTSQVENLFVRAPKQWKSAVCLEK